MPKWPLITRVPQGTRWPPDDGRGIVTSATDLGVFRADFGITLGSGTAVASWSTLTANNTVSQGTAAARPTFEPTGISGQPSLLFDGSNDALSGATALASALNGNDTPYAMYMVMQFVSLPGAQSCIIAASQSAAGNVYDYTGHTSGAAISCLRQAGDVQSSTSGGTPVISTTYVFRKFFSGTATTVRLNTAAAITAAAQDNATMGALLDNVTIGGLTSTGSVVQCSNVRIGEIRFYSAQPNASEDAALSNYFFNRYGVVS